MLNEGQERHVISHLRHAEELLARGLDELDAEPKGAVFSQKIPDATLSQLRVLRDHLAQLRFVIRRFMQAQSLTDRTEPLSGLWSFQTSVSFALISIEELRPEYLRGYGELDSNDATAVEQFVVEAQTLLRRVGKYLAYGTAEDLAARIEHLDGTREEIKLLGELERVISRRGLVELRTTLQDLVERARSPRLEIAFFGRVNAGKSSLLNWWLGSALLPTGITPVTAVPTRITHGAPSADVFLADGRTIQISIEELASYITEGGNPRNVKGVLEASIRTQSPRLRDGTTLVDTPGLGSLASAGALRTAQYLPRCDLGVVLLEAGAPIAEEDLNVARALLMNGADLLVVLSKADRLGEQELREALTYTEKELRNRIDPGLTIYAISTLPAQMALVCDWFTECVEPRLVHVREEAARFLKRKIAALRGSVITALELRLRGANRTLEPPSEEGDAAAWIEEVAQARARYDRLRRDISVLGAEVRAHTETLLATGAEELVHCWDEHQDLKSTSERVQSAMVRRGRAIGELVVQALEELRGQSELVARAAGAPTEELPALHGVPAAEFGWSDTATAFRRPWGLLGLDPLKRLLATRRLRRELGPIIAEQLAFYGQTLRGWATRYLEELGSAFEVVITDREGLNRARAAAPDASNDVQQMAQELQRLQRWPEGAAAAHLGYAST